MKVILFLAIYLTVAAAIEVRAQSSKEQIKVVPGISAKMLTFDFRFTYEKFPLKLRIFDLTKHGLPNNFYSNAKDLKDVPAGNEYKDFKVKVAKGDSQKFLFVVENSNDKPFYFFMSPHATEPARNALGHRAFCGCNGTIYFVRPKSTWYRVVTIETESAADVMTTVLNHKVVGVDPLKISEVQEIEEAALYWAFP